MDLEINKKNYKKKKTNSLYISLGFLFFVIVLNAGLYFYNISLENDNQDLENNIQIKENSIGDLQKDPKIVASNLYNLNIKTIKKIEDYSKITLYIDHMLKLRNIYNIDFKGFKYSGGNLTTQVIAKSDSVINYKKVVKFIRGYRANEDLSALFDLGLIKNVTSKNGGVDNIFNINMKLKNNISRILEISKEKKIELDKIKKQKFFNLKKEKLLKEKKEKLNSGNTINTLIGNINN